MRWNQLLSVEIALAIFGSVIFLGFIASTVFERHKIPDVMLLLFLGLLIGPILNVVNPADLIPFVSIIGTLALIVVLFDGGLHLNVITIFTEIPIAAIFSSVVFVLGTILAGGFLHFFLGWPILHALLLGVIAGGTGTNEVLPLIQRLTANEKTKVLITLDALVNDVLTFVFMFALLQIASTGSVSVGGAITTVASSFSIALVAGILCGLFWLGILRKFAGKSLGYMVTLGFLFLLYAGINFIGGSGALAVLFFSLIIGNSALIARGLNWRGDFRLDSTISSTQKEVSFFVRTFYFVYLGMLFSLNYFSKELLTIAGVALAGYLIARYIGALLIASLDSAYKQYKLLVTSMMPRGLISTVVLFLPAQHGIKIPYLVETVFLLVLLSNVVTIVGAFASEVRTRGKKGGPRILNMKLLSRK